jgi:hypothetical protein
MSGRDIPRAHEKDSAWTLENRQVGSVEFLGQRDDGTPAYYDKNNHVTFEGDVDHENRRVTPTNERSLDAEEKLGEVIEEFGDAVGWESLSDFAREHLEDESDDSAD